jgi:uncharacterized phiE125 gp8 family phage protein
MVNSYYTETVSPTELPITVDEAKEFLRIKSTVTVEDNLILGLLTSAVIFGETYTRRQFIERSWQGIFSVFESSMYESAVYVQIDKSPVNDITGIEIFNNNAFSPITTDWELKESKSFPRILFTEIPTFDNKALYIVRVSFNSGYGAAAAVPDIFKTAIKQHMAFLYENRGDVQAVAGESVPNQVKALYNSHRIINTF